MSEQEVKGKYMELQMLEQQMKQVQKQIQMIENQSIELTIAHQALESLKNIKPGTEILVPISNGVFIKAELKDNQELIVNIGSNITANKDAESAKGLIKEQIDEMKTVQEHMALELERLGRNAASIEKELHKMISEQ